MRLPIRRILSIGVVVVALGGLTATTANAAPASSVIACHTDRNTYEVRDPATGNYVEKTMGVYDPSGNYVGYIDVQLWYCPNYQSNFARAELYPIQGGLPAVWGFISVDGESGKGADAGHWLVPGVTAQDGSQDSPAYYAPSERTAACFIPSNLPQGYTYDYLFVCTQYV
jgi:hypothetical protein